jgi:hypothetical protein
MTNKEKNWLDWLIDGFLIDWLIVFFYWLINWFLIDWLIGFCLFDCWLFLYSGQDGSVIDQVAEEEDPVLIFTVHKSAKQTDFTLITGWLYNDTYLIPITIYFKKSNL